MSATSSFRVRIVMVVAVLLAAGCGADDPPTADVGRPGEAAELAYAECMREHGYDWPDPVWDGGGWDTHIEEEIDYDSPEYQQNAAECEEVRLEVGPAGMPDGGEDIDAFLQERLDFAACMRDEGIEFPDPQVDEQGIGELAGPIDGDQEAFDAATATCEAEIQGR